MTRATTCLGGPELGASSCRDKHDEANGVPANSALQFPMERATISQVSVWSDRPLVIQPIS